MAKELVAIDEFSFWDDGELGFKDKVCDSYIEVYLSPEQTKQLYLTMKKFYEDENNE